MKELDSAVIDDSLSLADVVRNATNEHGRSVQSKSYDVMYSATKSHRNEGRKGPHDMIHFIELFDISYSRETPICQGRSHV